MIASWYNHAHLYAHSHICLGVRRQGFPFKVYIDAHIRQIIDIIQTREQKNAVNNLHESSGHTATPRCPLPSPLGSAQSTNKLSAFGPLFEQPRSLAHFAHFTLTHPETNPSTYMHVYVISNQSTHSRPALGTQPPSTATCVHT